MRALRASFSFGHSIFEFVSDFGFHASNLAKVSSDFPIEHPAEMYYFASSIPLQSRLLYQGDKMTDEKLLEGLKILIVDDEPDVLETLEDLLTMCRLVRAETFEEAKTLLESQSFDLAILDIMGVSGYELLDLARHKNVISVMLTAYALSPENVVRSYKGGADSYIPKEEMANITTFLVDVLEARRRGENPWTRWYTRLASFWETKFGSDWKEGDKEFWEKFPFY
jgi:CheY-like chemotaxis protein